MLFRSVSQSRYGVDFLAFLVIVGLQAIRVTQVHLVIADIAESLVVAGLVAFQVKDYQDSVAILAIQVLEHLGFQDSVPHQDTVDSLAQREILVKQEHLVILDSVG